MKKALYVILCMTLAMTFLAGCGKKDDTDYFDEGYTAVENGKYKDALEDFKKAAAQGDEQAQKAADIVSGYLNAKEAADLGNTDSAKEFLSKIPSDYKFYPIAGDVNALRLKVYGSDAAAKDAADEAEANENSKTENTAESTLNEVEKLIGNGHIDLAEKKLDLIDYDSLDSSQKNKADTLRKKINNSPEKNESKDNDNSGSSNQNDEDFTSDKAMSYLQQYYHIEGDIGDDLSPNYDSDGRKYYEVTIQTGSGKDISIITLDIYSDGSIKTKEK